VPAAPSPDRPAAPREKAFSPTSDEALGTLPEGIGLAVGASMPDAALHDIKGNPVSLSKLREGGKSLLIVFYRGGWCPYCNFEIHDLTTAFPELQKRGVVPVAISVDKPEKAAETQASYRIPFPVLSDPDLVAHTAFSVIHTADAAEVERLRGFNIDIEGASGRTHHRFAVPALFLIDATGTVRWSHADLDYKTRPTSAQLLEVIDELDATAATP
jgi:peroxiredoxin